MALGSAGSPDGSQSILLHHRTPNHQNTQKSKNFIKYLKWTATIIAAVTFVMGFICTKVYISSATNLGITGLVKKAVFMIFVLCNSIPMLTVITIIDLLWTEHSNDIPITNKAMGRAMAFVTLAFVSMMVSVMVGVCLLLILLSWNNYFT